MPTYQYTYDESVPWEDRFSMVRYSDEEEESLWLLENPGSMDERYVEDTPEESIEDILDGQAPLVRDATLMGKSVFRRHYKGRKVSVTVPYMGSIETLDGVVVDGICYVFHRRDLVGFCDPSNPYKTMTSISTDIIGDKAVQLFLQIWREVGEMADHRVGLLFEMDGTAWTVSVVIGQLKIADLFEVMPYVVTDQERLLGIRKTIMNRVEKISQLDFIDPYNWSIPDYMAAYAAIGRDPYDLDTLAKTVMTAKSIVNFKSYIGNEIYCYPGALACGVSYAVPFAFANAAYGHEKTFARWCMTHILGHDPGDDYLEEVEYGYEDEED